MVNLTSRLLKVTGLTALHLALFACQARDTSPDAPGAVQQRPVDGETEFVLPGCCRLLLPAGWRLADRGASDAKGAVFESESARLLLEYDAEPSMPINTRQQQHSMRTMEFDGKPARLYSYAEPAGGDERLLSSITIYTRGRERMPGARVTELKYVCRRGTNCPEFQGILDRLKLQQ